MLKIIILIVVEWAVIDIRASFRDVSKAFGELDMVGVPQGSDVVSAHLIRV